jgi:hypothetical protein
MIQCECTCVCCDTQTFCPGCSRRLTPRTIRPFDEAEWLACNNLGIVMQLAPGLGSERKRRLFACACARQLWRLLPDPRSRIAVGAAECFADGLIDSVERTRAYAGALDVCREKGTFRGAPWLAAEAVSGAPQPSHAVNAILPRPGPLRPAWAWLTRVARDVFGNPFHTPHLDPAWLAWEGGTVCKLAEGIYQDQAFDRLPVLADALEEAGCTDESLLSHLRGGGPHARGCWAIDLLLGKE